MSIRGTIRIAAILAVGAIGVRAAALMDSASWDGGLTSPAMAAEPTRDSYIKENEGRFAEWGKNVDKLSKDTARKSEKAQKAASEKVNAAWADVKKNWADLKASSKETWSDAKRSLEESWAKLERAWDEAKR